MKNSERIITNWNTFWVQNVEQSKRENYMRGVLEACDSYKLLGNVTVRLPYMWLYNAMMSIWPDAFIL